MKSRIRYNFVEPSVIMSVVVSLMILGVGVFAFFIVIDETTKDNYGPSKTTCFTTFGDNPNTYTLPSNTISIGTITEYFNDGSTRAIDSGNYTWSVGTPGTIYVNVTGGG